MPFPVETIKNAGIQFIKYGSVGVCNTIITVTTMYLLRSIGFGYQLYTLIGYALGIVFSFFVNKRFTFNFTAGNRRTVYIRFGRFLGVALTLLALVQLLEWIFIDIMHVSELIGVAVPMVIYTVTGFVINRLWVFQ